MLSIQYLRVNRPPQSMFSATPLELLIVICDFAFSKKKRSIGQNGKKQCEEMTTMGGTRDNK